MTKYELMYILLPTTSPEVHKDIEEEIKSYFMEVSDITNWGLKEFAHELKHIKSGFYVILQGTGESTKMAALIKMLNLNKNVFRHLLINISKEKVKVAKKTKTVVKTKEPEND